jgi:naphthoate synthase
LEQLETVTLEWAKKIQEKSPLSIRMLKSAFNAELDGQAGIQELAGNATLLYYLSEEAKEGQRSFLEKRTPDFSKFPKFP